MKKTALVGLLPEEIAALLNGEPIFRAKQIFSWIYKGVRSFDEMTTISLELRTFLTDTAVLFSSAVTQKLSDPDGTVKLQITLEDGAAVETVLLTDSEGRRTACVSCQVGCAMQCGFCKTGTLGFKRNLTAAEITEQFLFLEAECGKLDNIVFMGMGEPLLNLSEIRKAIAVLCHTDGRALSRRRITLSTAGIIDGIIDLADNGPDIRLAVSLTVADEAVRTNLMPVTKAHPLGKLREAITYYTEKTNNRCTLEIPLLSGVNTTNESVSALIGFCKNLSVHVNLIPWNPAAGLPFKEPSAAQTAHIKNSLERAGLSVTVRTRRGRKIGGACGQLGNVGS